MGLNKTIINAKRKKNVSLWPCVLCGKKNLANAKFCGACGSSKTGVRNVSRTALENQNFQQMPSGVSNRTLQTVKDKMIVVSLAIFMFLTISFSIVFAMNMFSSPNNTSSIKWKQFRTFLSHRFMLTDNELDAIVMPKCNISNISSSIDYYQVSQIERALKEKFEREDLSLFPNPYFEVSAMDKHQLKFSDVELDHPIYRAINTLLEFGLKLGNKNNNIDPYGKITWISWKKVALQLLKVLSLNDQFIYEFVRNKSGSMTNYDVNNFLRMLRQKTGLNIEKGLLWSEKEFYPSRLEAFSTLSQVLSELES